MNRLGRGYSFEALRAKILFSEGAFKTEKKRPKFERKPANQVAERNIGYSLVTNMDDGEYLDIPALLRRSTEGDESTEELVNYGLDISTITALIEKGLL